MALTLKDLKLKKRQQQSIEVVQEEKTENVHEKEAGLRPWESNPFTTGPAFDFRAHKAAMEAKARTLLKKSPLNNITDLHPTTKTSVSNIENISKIPNIPEVFRKKIFCVPSGIIEFFLHILFR